MQSHLTKKSSNSKVGPIPVSTTSFSSCPDACPLKESGCYASEGFHLNMHWKKVTEGKRGTDFDSFIEQIKKLPENTPWRHNQAGDLSGKGNEINVDHLEKLTEANGSRNGWTYTHKPITEDFPENRKAIQKANSESNFTVNISANSIQEAEQFHSEGFPSVVVVPEDFPEKAEGPQGTKIVVCPEQTGKAESCAKCLLCTRKNRKVIVGFRVHGTGKNKVSFDQ